MTGAWPPQRLFQSVGTESPDNTKVTTDTSTSPALAVSCSMGGKPVPTAPSTLRGLLSTSLAMVAVP